MNPTIDISLSSWSLGLNSPVLRHPFRRAALRHADFEDRYDFQTVFYDCFWSADGKSLRLIGPPLQNLTDDLGLRFFAMPSGEELTATTLARVFATLLTIAAPANLQCLRVESAAGTAFIVPQPNLSSLFAGRRVLMTLSQNNELEWIRDWVIYHQRLHGCDAAIVYDNNSTRYDLSELNGCLSGIAGVTGLAVNWPFRYGPFDGRLPLTYDLWEGHFCQFGMLEHARFRFLQTARCALNLDIDELVVTPNGESICDLTEASATGFLKFGGKWVEPYTTVPRAPGTKPLHRHYHHRKAGRVQGCENKYTVAPARVPESAQFGIHDIFGHLASGLPEGVELRHFKAINTNWTVDQPGTLKGRTEAAGEQPELIEDLQLASFLDAAFAETPATLTPARRADPETALYQARLKSAQLLRHHQPEAAERHLRDALATAPDWPSARLFQAELLDRLGASAAAQEARQEAQRLQQADPASNYQRGRYRLHRGEWTDALRSLHRTIRKDPSFAPAYVTLGRLYWSAGHQRGAERIFQRGLDHCPSSALLHAAMADIMLTTGRPQSALTHCEAALLLQPGKVRMLMLRARALRDLGQPAEALQSAAEALKLQSDNALLMAQFGAAIDHPFDCDYPEIDPMGAALEYLTCLLEAGRPAEADAFSGALLRDHPDRPQAYEARLQVLEALGQGEAPEATEMLARAIDAAQREFDTLPPQTLGRNRQYEWHDSRFRRLHGLLQRAGRDEEAARLLDRELAENPDSPLAALQVWSLLSSQMQGAKARTLIEATLRRMPRDARLWTEYGRLLERGGDLPAALAAYRKALFWSPKQVWLLSHVAYLLYRRAAGSSQALAEAEAMLRQALALDDRHALSHSRLGDVLWQTGRKAEALSAWRQAVSITPDEAWLWSHLGGRLVDSGDLAEAEAALQTANRLRPEDTLTQFRLSRLHEERKDFPAAIAHMTRALALAPGEAWMWRHHSRLLAKAGHAEDATAAARTAEGLAAHATEA